jgi:hypothetical protein
MAVLLRSWDLPCGNSRTENARFPAAPAQAPFRDPEPGWRIARFHSWDRRLARPIEKEHGEVVMNARMLVASLMLFSAAAAATPVSAAILEPVAGRDLDQFIGLTVRGQAYAPLGVVGWVDPAAGVIQIVGSHGEVALLHVSALLHDGVILRAPTISVGDVHEASERNLSHPGTKLVGPSISIKEPPLG